MNDYERAESDIGKIYRILKEKNYFQESDFNTRYLPQLQRNMRQFQNISTKLVVAKLKPKEFVNWHNQNVPTLCYDESNFQLEVMTLLCQHGLSTFELFKRFLLNILDLEKINEKTNSTLKNTSMLGDLVNSLKKILTTKTNQIDNLIDVEFRNTLAHDSWYLDNNFFKFMSTKGRQHELSVNDVYHHVVKIWLVNRAITKKYTEDYYPEIVELYEKELGTIMNEAMPMYQED
jgi:hypothetical protein